MIHFVLDDLGGEAGEFSAPLLPAEGRPFQLHPFRAERLPRARQGETALLRLIGLF